MIFNLKIRGFRYGKKLILFIVIPIILFFIIGMFLTISKISTSLEEQLSVNVITQAKNYAAIMDAEHDEIGQLSEAFNHMTLQLKQQLYELKKQYTAREVVENELKVARDIQSSLIPNKFPAFPDYDEFDLHAINHAASHVAGDFFDFFFLILVVYSL